MEQEWKLEQAGIATVFNLTTSPIETDIAQLPQKGLKFVPTLSYSEGGKKGLKTEKGSLRQQSATTLHLLIPSLVGHLIKVNE